MDLTSYATLAVRALIGVVFLTAAIEKALQPRSFAARLRSYGVGPKYRAVVAIVLIVVEASIALSLLLGIYWRIALMGSALLLSTFAVVARHATAEASGCGCGGIVELLGGGSVAGRRNAALAAASAIAALGDHSALSFTVSPPFLAHAGGGNFGIGIVVGYVTISTLMAYVAAAEIRRLRAWRLQIDSNMRGGSRG